MKIILNVNRLLSGTKEAYSQGVAFVSIYDVKEGIPSLIAIEKLTGKTEVLFRRVVTGVRPALGVYAIEVEAVNGSIADVTMAQILEDDAEIPPIDVATTDPLAEFSIIAEDSKNESNDA
jgi:hypothetical protein